MKVSISTALLNEAVFIDQTFQNLTTMLSKFHGHSEVVELCANSKMKFIFCIGTVMLCEA